MQDLNALVGQIKVGTCLKLEHFLCYEIGLPKKSLGNKLRCRLIQLLIVSIFFVISLAAFLTYLKVGTYVMLVYKLFLCIVNFTLLHN